MPESQDLKQSLLRAARDLRRRGEEATLRYQHLDAVRTAQGDPAAVLAELIGEATADELAAMIHLGRLLKVTGLDEAIADAALRKTVPLAAKSAAIRALEDGGTDVPHQVTETLALAERFVQAPDPAGLQAVRELPEAWRQPTLDAWASSGIAVDPNVAATALGAGLVEALRVADGLGAHGDASAVPLLSELAASDDRIVAKAAKRALHQLKARGVSVEEDGPGEAFSLEIPPDITRDSLAYVTGIDGLGGRIMWILSPNASGRYDLLEAVTDDVHGIRKAEILDTTRGDFRRHMTRLRDNPSVLLAIAPATAVAGFLRAAEALNIESQTDIPERYTEFREGAATVLFETSESWDPGLPACPATEDERREVLRGAVELLGAQYFAAWAILGTAVDDAAAAVRAAETSEILVDDEQRKRQVDQAISGVADSFDARERTRFKRRLHEMARVMAAAGDEADAIRALVAGDAFETVEDLYADHPFARAIIQRGVMAAYQHLREHEPPPGPEADDGKSGIIQT